MFNAELLSDLRNSFVAGFDGGWRLFWSPFGGVTRELRPSLKGVLREAELSPVPEVTHQGITGPTPPVSQASVVDSVASPEQNSDLSVRIPQLSESSREIGAITELISEITEQTNQLVLNAFTQAAAAGEAGRGLSVVAEEVRQLAARSSDASRQISAIVRTIQTDTLLAMATMEHSTPSVVEGAPMSRAACTKLADIDRVTRELAELIEQVSSNASLEAESARVVAANIQDIFGVTEQTGESAR